MPELPEVEITARRLDEALAGAEIESTMAPGINALKTFDPPLHALDGRTIEGIRRRGKHLVIDVEGELAVLVHLMSAGRLQLYDKRASLRDRTSRLLIRVAGGGAHAAQESRVRAGSASRPTPHWVAGPSSSGNSRPPPRRPRA